MIDFDSRVQIIQGFTSNVPELESAIRRTNAGGSTSLYNAIYIALKELKKTRARYDRGGPAPGHRRTVGWRRHVESRQLRGGARAREAIRDRDLCDWLRSRESGIPSKGFSEADFVFRQLSQETGGRVFFARQINELANIYGQIADELSSQYTIGYTSKNPKRDGAYRRWPSASTCPTPPHARNRDITGPRRRERRALTNAD